MNLSGTESSVSQPSDDIAAPAVTLPRLVEGEEANAAAQDALRLVGESHPWLARIFAGPLTFAAPLLEAALQGTDRPHGARWATHWSEGVSDGLVADAAKHEAYVAYMRGVMAELAPWLPELLDSASALVVVYPGFCSYAVDTRLAHLFAMHPEIIQRTTLLPWVEQGDEKH